MEDFRIDIDKVIRSKAGKKARFVPRFVVNYLKRIVHQDEINRFIEREGDKEGVEWIQDCLDYLGIRFELEGEENLPAPDDHRRYTFVSNHPMGAIDGMGLGFLLGSRYENGICYLANDLLMNLRPLASLFIGVNKFGGQGHTFAQQVRAGFESDKHIIMFPADLCSRKVKGVLHDVPWKKTFITKSVEAHRDVVPIHFGGENSKFFYRLANISKALGIKFNIAMLYLSNEMFKNRDKTFTVKFGKPIPWQTFDSSRTPREWALYVEDEVYKL